MCLKRGSDVATALHALEVMAGASHHFDGQRICNLVQQKLLRREARLHVRANDLAFQSTASMPVREQVSPQAIFSPGDNAVGSHALFSRRCSARCPAVTVFVAGNVCVAPAEECPHGLCATCAAFSHFVGCLPVDNLLGICLHGVWPTPAERGGRLWRESRVAYHRLQGDFRSVRQGFRAGTGHSREFELCVS